MHGNSAHGNRETLSTPIVQFAAGRLEKAMSQKISMHVGGESDGCVVPMKCPNNGGKPPAEGMEGRRPAKENTVQATAPRTQSRTSELSDLNGVRKAAHEEKRTKFTALLHHVTVGLLRDSYHALKRDAVPGVDGLTWKEYETELELRWRTCTAGCIWERNGRSLRREPTYRKPMDDRDLWASLLWRTKSFSRLWR